MAMMNKKVEILLVEDNLADASLLNELIMDTGFDYQITMLDDGEKANKFFQARKRVDLIVMDLNLPRANGHEVIKALRTLDTYKKTSIIIMTGSNSPADRELAIDNGANYYLIKPMSLQEMESTTRTLKAILGDVTKDRAN
jgi:CheY-like chemotaxis protein